MPVTPFHFGVGLLAKGAAPERVSLGAFVAAQVVIDCESAYFLLRDEWPVHRVLHTFALAAPVGAAAGLALAALLRARWRGVESAWGPALLGGLLGGLTHPLLDGLMHADIRPLRPFSDANPLLGLIGLPALHLACVLAGLLGAVLWFLRARSA